MTENPFNEDWQKIKYLAGRLQTIASLLDFVSKKSEQIDSSQEIIL